MFGEAHNRKWREENQGDFNDDDRAVAEAMMSYFTNFAYTGYVVFILYFLKSERQLSLIVGGIQTKPSDLWASHKAILLRSMTRV